MTNNNWEKEYAPDEIWRHPKSKTFVKVSETDRYGMKYEVWVGKSNDSGETESISYHRSYNAAVKSLRKWIKQHPHGR